MAFNLIMTARGKTSVSEASRVGSIAVAGA
jgi:hypothetical protein